MIRLPAMKDFGILTALLLSQLSVSLVIADEIKMPKETIQTMKVYIDPYGNIFMKEHITTVVDLPTDENQTKIIEK